MLYILIVKRFELYMDFALYKINILLLLLLFPSNIANENLVWTTIVKVIVFVYIILIAEFVRVIEQNM